MLDQLLHDDNLRKLLFSSIVAVYGANTRQVRRMDVLKFTLYLASTAGVVRLVRGLLFTICLGLVLE